MLNGYITTDVLRSAVTPTTIFESECTLATRPENGVIAIHSTDHARVGWVDISLHKEAFDSLQWDTMEIGLDLTKCLAFVDVAPEGAPTQLTIEDANERLTLQSANLSLHQSQIVPGYVPKVLERPAVDAPASVALPGDALDPVITLATEITNQMTLGVDVQRDVFYASAEGDTDSVRMVFDREDTIRLQTADVQAEFDLDYLEDLQEALPDDTVVQIALGETTPAVIRYPFAQGYGVVTVTLRHLV